MHPVYDESDPFENLARELIRLSFVLRQDLETELNQLSEVPREFVRLIVRSPGITIVELSQLASKQKSNSSSAVAELERKGFVRREPNELDKRSMRIFPTERAQQEIRAIYRQWSIDLKSWAAELPARERNAVLSAVPGLSSLTEIAERGHSHSTVS